MKLKLLSSFLILSLGVALSQAPVVPPQPDSATYSTASLELFPTYTRASFEAAFAKQAPAFDPSRAPKAWFDSSATGPRNYKVVGNNVSVPEFDVISLSEDEASSVNLPGLPHFDTYVGVTVSNVTFSCSLPGCVPSPVGVALQSTRAQAEALKAEIGDTTLTITETVGPTAPGSAFFYTKTDPNGPGIFELGPLNVGQALASRNSKGIGYPGKWSQPALGYTFVFDNLNDGASAGAALRVPVRDLLPNEILQTQLAGLIPVPVIARLDFPGVVPAGNGGDFSAADRDTLNQILQLLKKAFGQ